MTYQKKGIDYLKHDDTEESYLVHNQAFKFYEVMYDYIIKPMYDAFLNEDAQKVYNMLILLIIHSTSMFKGSDDKKVCNSILENVKSQKANILALGGYNTIEKKRDMALKRSKILHELYDGLYGLYEIMDKYNMRVWRSSKSTLPSVVQSSRNR